MAPVMRVDQGGHRRHGTAISLKTIMLTLLFGICCFYVGFMVGTQTVAPTEQECSRYRNLESVMANRIDNQASKIDGLKQKLGEANGPRFPPEISSFAAGMALLPRESFASRFDVGVPVDKASPSNEQVLLFYNHEEALPTSDSQINQQAKSNNMQIPQIDNINMATENCDSVNLILAQENDKRQCFAMMGQFRSYHIQKFLRLPEESGAKLDPHAPLRLVNRGAQASGRLSAKPPTKEQTETYWKSLTTYLQTLDSVLERLKPLAEKVAKDNTIIVMVCNYGQSELLMNFVCAAKSKALDVSQVLVFATDEETKALAEGLGLTAFYDETNYGDMPKEAAGRYADKTFAAMMMAKVYCVQQIMLLGYDVLFMDVDIIWFKHPLGYFHDESSPVYKHDIFFQDDGSRGLFYAPYSSNTGFYYVRNNDKTRYFFNQLLLGGDLIIATKSHQIALVSLLSEHASMYGLKVKVLSRDEDDFPGGHAFHNRHDFMKDVVQGKAEPYIFHMSWTANKKNKERFFRQLGGWYLKDQCLAKEAPEILGDKEVTTPGSLLEPCCSQDYLFECFYRDKPSIKPCKEKDPLDKGKKSFW